MKTEKRDDCITEKAKRWMVQLNDMLLPWIKFLAKATKGGYGDGRTGTDGDGRPARLRTDVHTMSLLPRADTHCGSVTARSVLRPLSRTKVYDCRAGDACVGTSQVPYRYCTLRVYNYTRVWYWYVPVLVPITSDTTWVASRRQSPLTCTHGHTAL